MAPSAAFIFPSPSSLAPDRWSLVLSCSDLNGNKYCDSLTGDFTMSVDRVNALFRLRSSMDVGMLAVGVAGAELHLHDSVELA